MRARLTAAALAATALAAAVPTAGHAATSRSSRPQVADPVGDAKGGVATFDVVSGRWSVTGRGAAKSLTAVLTLAGAPNTDRGFSYELKSDVRGCGTVWFEYAPGTVSEATNALGQKDVNDGLGAYSLWLNCGGGESGPAGESMLVYRELTFTVKDNVITWSVPFSALPRQVQPGAIMEDFEAIADVAEPVMGLSTTGGLGQGLDYGRGDGVWIVR